MKRINIRSFAVDIKNIDIDIKITIY